MKKYCLQFDISIKIIKTKGFIKPKTPAIAYYL